MSSLPEDGRFLLTFKEYPPSRVGGSLSIEKALAMVQNGASDGGKDPAQRRAGSEDFNG